MKRTNLVLFGLAVALFGYVTLVDRHGLSTGEVDERKDRLVPELVRDRLVTIAVERDGLRYSLARQERDGDGNLRFAFETPLHVAADSERVAEALSSIEWAEPTRTLQGVDAADRRRFGLDHPRLRLRFTVGDRQVVVAFGGEEPTGAGTYVSVGDAVHVVSRETREAFDHPIEFFRVRRLVDVPAVVDAVRVVSPAGEVRATRTEGMFHLSAPVDALASEGRVNVVLATLRTLEASRFVDENPGDVARFGLTTPRILVEIGDAAHPAAVRVAVGSACDVPASASYLRVGDGPVVCVPDAELEPLLVPPNSYRELRASATESGGVASLDLADGRATLSVRDEDGVLRFALGDTTGDADPESFEEWVEGLRDARATGTEPVTPAFAPTTTLTVHRTGTRADDVIRFQVRADSVVGRRGEDAILLVFPKALADRLVVSTAHVRARGLLHEDPSSLRALVIVRAGVPETLTLVDDEIRVTAPVAVAAESARVAELAARLAGLEAVRFVADSPRPEFGLDRPRYEIRFVLGETSHSLAIGAIADDGAYARLDGNGAVFVVVDATVELASTPFASRQELATESLYVETISVKRGATTSVLARDGVHFTRSGAPLTDDRGNAVLDALGELRAVAIAAYGPPRPETGLARPVAEIRVRRSVEAGDPRDVVLLVGATIGSAEDARTFVRRIDRNVVYQVLAVDLAKLLDLGE